MTRKKNIVLILTDQLRADILSCYGGAICQTPALDKLASESVVFDRAYTPLAVCSPARASLMTGQYPHNHGVASNGDAMFHGTLQDSPRLLSRRLEAVGYDRWYNGKWHLGGRNPAHVPETLGFPGTQLPGHGAGGYRFAEYKQYLKDRGLKFEYADGPHRFGGHDYGTLQGPEEVEVSAFLADDAISFLDRQQHKPQDSQSPFFLWVNIWGPHAPYFATQEYLDIYKDVEIPPWPNFHDTGENKPVVHQTKIPPEAREAGWAFWEPAVRHYFAFMTMIDRQIGRILDKIDDAGLREDTMVIFAADHGESIGAHGCQDKGHFMYEETYRVPLMIRDSQILPRRENALVSLVDLCPTMLEIAGDPSPEEERDGRSMVSLLRGDEPEWRKSLAAEFHGIVTPFTQRMIVDDRYKYVWNLGDLDECYDLEADPHELCNLISDPRSSSLLYRLQLELLEWMRQTKDPALDYYLRHLAHSNPQFPIEKSFPAIYY